jgi:hypothetical protein
MKSTSYGSVLGTLIKIKSQTFDFVLNKRISTLYP